MKESAKEGVRKYVRVMFNNTNDKESYPNFM